MSVEGRPQHDLRALSMSMSVSMSSCVLPEEDGHGVGTCDGHVLQLPQGGLKVGLVLLTEGELATGLVPPEAPVSPRLCHQLVVLLTGRSHRYGATESWNLFVSSMIDFVLIYLKSLLFVNMWTFSLLNSLLANMFVMCLHQLIYTVLYCTGKCTTTT